jgi:hypothetical protein
VDGDAGRFQGGEPEDRFGSLGAEDHATGGHLVEEFDLHEAVGELDAHALSELV